MFSNYLKVALRNLARYKGHSLINIAGLAVGMACCMLILLWVQNELSYDRFHTNADNLYRVVQENSSVTSPPFAPALKEEIPEVVDATRYREISQCLLKVGDRRMRGAKTAMVDTSFFDMFTVSFISGDSASVLEDSHCLVLTERVAAMLFGDKNPVGRLVTFDNRTEFRVTGVIRDFPETSHMSFDAIARFEYLTEMWLPDINDWENFSYRTYVQLPDLVDLAAVSSKINDMYDRHSPGNTRTLHLQPVVDIQLYEVSGQPGAIVYVYVFSTVALVVLAIACINFINLTTARGARRAREIGVRKVTGATRPDLIRQFLGEAIVMALGAFVLAGAIVEASLPAFGNLTGKTLTFDLTANPAYLAGAVTLVLVTGVLAGFFPALQLSNYKPIKILKGDLLSSGGGRSRLRKLLVITQFSLSVFLIIGSLVIQRQLDFVAGADLGYDRDNIICLKTNVDEIRKIAPAFREMSQHTGITAGTLSGNVPGRRESSTDKVDWDGKNPNEHPSVEVIYAGYGFLETFGIELADGRFYSPEFPSDLENAFVVNESLVREMGISGRSALGERFTLYDKTGTIVGVVKDFHSESLRRKISPLVINLAPGANDNLSFRLNPDDVQATIAYMKDTWSKYAPDYPFEFTFFDQTLHDLYKSEERMGKIFTAFTVLAIVISCLGLLGLVSFMAERRVKEIGIRKVLGASIFSIVRLVSSEFVILVLIANAVAWPSAYWIMQSWLDGFAYRAEMGWSIFALSGTISVIVAIATVAYKAVVAARTNPIEAIKYE